MQKTRNILLIIVIAAIIIYSGFLLWRKSQPEPVRYELVKSSFGDVERIAVFTGRIVPSDEVEIKPYIGGILNEIYVSEGDFVRKGDTIAQIEVISDVEKMVSAQSLVNEATIEADEQRQIYDRNKYLYAEGAISTAEMQKVEAAHRNAQNRLSTAEENLNIIKHGYNRTSGAGNILVRSTISGLIITLPQVKGTIVIPTNILNKGTTIATVGDIYTSEFVFNVDETEIDRLYPDMPLRITFGVNDSLSIDGRIKSISLLGMEKRGAAFYEVKSSMNVPENVFIPVRSSAKAEISMAKKENVLLVPESAISFENDSTFVYLAEKKLFDYSFTKKHVELGLSDKLNVEVLSELEDNTNLRGNRLASKKK